MADKDQTSLFPDEPADGTPSGPVECLGMTFENDEKRREHFLEKLREKLKDPEFRKIEGFPIGKNEDILALSDPPYYTACPNPWIADFTAEWESTKPAKPPGDKYHREPFAVDVSEGKTHAIYKAHSYHTKVPHLAIVPSILHYTEPGDIVLDGFSGSGMTGVAAQWCGAAPQEYRRELEQRWKDAGHDAPQWGLRHCILNDLSPAATFIAANYNLPFDVNAFAKAAKKLLAEVEDEIGWMYETRHTDGSKARIEYTVWSEVFTCPDCAGEVVFLDEALDEESKSVADEFPCPHCNVILNKRNLERRFESEPDMKLSGTWKHVTFRPVLISYKIGKHRYEKAPDDEDLKLIQKIQKLDMPAELPSNRFPIEQMYHGSRIAPKGFTHIHHFFLPRAAQALGLLWRKAKAHPDARIRDMLLFLLDQSIWGFSVQNRYRLRAYSHVNQCMTGVYYVPSQTAEVSPWYNLDGKVSRLPKAFNTPYAQHGGIAIGTASTGSLSISADSIDYIFTDPPFGENIYYADLNFMVEAWYGVHSNAIAEAIVDKAKKKGLPEYQELMRRCFAEYCRVLKPGRWITIVFHNSRNAVWNAIQEALQAVGFVVADVRTLDKQQGSYRQVTSTATKQDLVISAYKPNGGLEERFKLKAGTEDGAWDFVRTHLRQLPVFVAKDSRAETLLERQSHLLYDRMVAFHVQRGVTVPLSSAEFFQGLSQRFPERDNMYFLSEQVAEYDKKRMTVGTVEKAVLIPKDEESAIQWLRQELRSKPRSFQQIHPDFIKSIAWIKHEKPLELSEMLEQNFIRYDGKGEVPSQIHSYLSSNFKELRKLAKDDPALKTKAKDRWYVPDPNKAGDLEKLRERSLLREFEEYRESKQKRLKVFRLEAVRAGFKKAWQEKSADGYQTIIEVAKKIPEKVLQEDPKLLMWYDQAVTRAGEE